MRDYPVVFAKTGTLSRNLSLCEFEIANLQSDDFVAARSFHDRTLIELPVASTVRNRPRSASQLHARERDSRTRHFRMQGSRFES